MSLAPRRFAPSARRGSSAYKAPWNEANHGGYGEANYWKMAESVQPNAHEADRLLATFHSPSFQKFQFPLISWRNCLYKTVNAGREHGSVACSRAHQSPTVDHISHLGIDTERGHRLVVECPVRAFC